MPGIITSFPVGSITKFTNCRLLHHDVLIEGDLWISSSTWTIISSQTTFFDGGNLPDQVIDLGGRIVSPGLIDVQLNGAFGFNFSTWIDDDKTYSQKVEYVNRKLVETGVTSYMPTITSQTPEMYKKVLPLLRSRADRIATLGAESLGVHVEGPFLSKAHNGCHNKEMIREAHSWGDLVDCYGEANLGTSSPDGETPISIRKITVAPEQGQMMSLIQNLTSRNIIVSIGHSDASFEGALTTVKSGASMITHLFNAMKPLHHRNPGIFGLLGLSKDKLAKPYFGMIADGVHVHPTAVQLAYNAHPEGLILVTDAMHLTGLPDGAYPWTNGDSASTIVKKGSVLCLEGTDKIAGSSITLIECVNNFLNWSGGNKIAEALRCVTATPANMLGIGARKGHLQPGADADVVVFSEKKDEDGKTSLVVDEVWKFGLRVHQRPGSETSAPTSPLHRV